MISNPAVMVTPCIFLLLLQLALASTSCFSYGGPSILEYDIDKQLTYRNVPRNLVAGWRQYGDRQIYK